jgi:hypothetical protein
LRIFRYPLKSLKHEVELSYTGEIVGFAFRTLDLVFCYVGFHFTVCPTVNYFYILYFLHVIFNKLICPEPGLAFLAVHEGIGKASHVAGSHPSHGIH